MQHVIERDDLLREIASIPRLRTQSVDPTDDPLVEIRIDPHRIEHFGVIFEEPWKDLIDVSNWERIIRTVIASRTFRSRTTSVPSLTLRIAVTYKENVFRRLATGNEHGYGLRLAETGQVVKVTVLTISVFHIVIAVPNRRGGDDGNGVAPHRAHELAAAACELVSRHRRGILQCRGAPGDDG